MKYFTPELLVAYGSDDDAVWQDADDRWEDACDRFNAYFEPLKAELPPGLRHIVDSYYLHDARIYGMGGRDSQLVLFLQLDTPPQSLLTFAFDLVEDPVILRDVLPPERRSPGDLVDWLYDEIEKVDGQPPTWRISILLSNGWEVQLHFRDVKVEEVQALLPAPRNGAATLSPGVPQPA